MAALARDGAELKTLGAVWRDFRARRSPRLLALGIALALAARLAAGEPGWGDAVAAATMLAIYPFGEWAIHVHLLHLPPVRWRGRRVELVTARAHRQHHEAPSRMGLILLGPLEVLALLGLAVPLVVGLGAAGVALVAGSPPLGPLLTALVTGYVLVGVYEWCHFVIHSAHRPRTRFFRAVWRAHRLHHYKNEHYWHGITSTVADRVMGTAPNQREVPRSATARTLSP